LPRARERAWSLPQSPQGIAVFTTGVWSLDAAHDTASYAGRVSPLRRLAPARVFDRQIRKLNLLAG
jgi:hypothetical protein